MQKLILAPFIFISEEILAAVPFAASKKRRRFDKMTLWSERTRYVKEGERVFSSL